MTSVAHHGAWAMSPDAPPAWRHTGRRLRLVCASVQGRASLRDDRARTLEAMADVTWIATDRTMSPEEAVDAFAGADVVAMTPKVSPPVDADLIARLPRLRTIVLHATGYDFVDVPALDAREVALSVLPDYSTQAVAEHTLALVLSMSTRLHLANDRSRARVAASTSLRGFEVADRTLGIIGCGRIGGSVARLAQGIGMRTVAHDIDPKPVPGVTYLSRAELLATSDVVTLHCPHVFGTPPLLGADDLARMRTGAVLVNSSRTTLVDDAAVVAAIRQGRLRGYALDEAVFVPAVVGDLLDQGRILQTGHSAWWSDETLERGATMWADHIEAALHGEPVHLVGAARPASTVEAATAAGSRAGQALVPGVDVPTSGAERRS